MFKLMGKKILTILRLKNCLTGPMYINILKQELSSDKTYEHNLSGKRYVVKRLRSHVAVKFGVFVVMVL